MNISTITIRLHSLEMQIYLFGQRVFCSIGYVIGSPELHGGFQKLVHCGNLIHRTNANKSWLFKQLRLKMEFNFNGLPCTKKMKKKKKKKKVPLYLESYPMPMLLIYKWNST